MSEQFVRNFIFKTKTPCLHIYIGFNYCYQTLRIIIKINHLFVKCVVLVDIRWSVGDCVRCNVHLTTGLWTSTSTMIAIGNRLCIGYISVLYGHICMIRVCVCVCVCVSARKYAFS